MSLQVEIVTPERQVAVGSYDFVVATASDGEVGILPGHHPLLTVLGIGPVRLHRQGAGGETVEKVLVEGGFLEVQGDRVIVLARSAERPGEIDVERARRAEARARERLAKPAGVDVARAQAALQRALFRIRSAERS